MVSDTLQLIWDLFESSSIYNFAHLSSKLTDGEKVEGLRLLSKTSDLGYVYDRDHSTMGEGGRNTLNLVFAIA